MRVSYNSEDTRGRLALSCPFLRVSLIAQTALIYVMRISVYFIFILKNNILITYLAISGVVISILTRPYIKCIRNMCTLYVSRILHVYILYNYIYCDVFRYFIDVFLFILITPIRSWRVLILRRTLKYWNTWRCEHRASINVSVCVTCVSRGIIYQLRDGLFFLGMDHLVPSLGSRSPHLGGGGGRFSLPAGVPQLLRYPGTAITKSPPLVAGLYPPSPMGRWDSEALCGVMSHMGEGPRPHTYIWRYTRIITMN